MYLLLQLIFCFKFQIVQISLFCSCSIKTRSILLFSETEYNTCDYDLDNSKLKENDQINSKNGTLSWFISIQKGEKQYWVPLCMHYARYRRWRCLCCVIKIKWKNVFSLVADDGPVVDTKGVVRTLELPEMSMFGHGIGINSRIKCKD